jgi:predicted dehydrogenase
MGVSGNSVRWGLWGTGRISHHVAQDLRLVPGACISLVGGRRLDAAQQLAAQHPGAVAIDSLERLIASSEVDAVYIATPDGQHRDDALAVLAAGKPVLCEKPLASSLADVQALVDAAERGKVFLMEAMWTRFLPAIVEIKRRVTAGEIGDVKFMQGSFAYSDVQADARRGHAPYPSLAQSMLYDRGIYLIALAQHLHKGDVVRANARCMEWGERSLCQFDLQLDRGALLAGVCGNASELANTFEIVGTRGTISIPAPFFKAHGFTLNSLQETPAAAAVSRNDSSAASWVAQAKQLKRQLQPLPAALRAARRAPFNFPGNGYQFQFAEVARCLAAGRTQSEVMSWADSLALARALARTSDATQWISRA